MKVVIVPGIFSECVAEKVSTFSYARTHLQNLGYETEIIQVRGRSSSRDNAEQIRNALIQMALPDQQKIVLVGYSKGVPDILEAIVYYPELHRRIAAVVSVSGVVNGTPIADHYAAVYDKLLRRIPFASCPPGDGGEIDSLRRSTRLKWLSQNTLPSRIRYFSIAGFADRNDISTILKPLYDKTAQVDPRNDSQVIFYDAIIPRSTLLGFVKADHWAIAMPFSRDTPALAATLINRNRFPREILLEAIIKFVEESMSAPG